MFKYRLPKISEDIYIRKRLIDKFINISNKKLILIEGEAGSGKTTFLSMLFNNKSNYSYITCDIEDKNKNVFLKEILESFSDRNFNFIIPRSELLNLLIERLNSFDKDLYLIFDDFHEIYGEDEIIETIKILIKETNPNVHFIISSRYKIIDPFNHFIIRDLASIIDSNEMKLSYKEVEEFFKFKKIKLRKVELQNIYEKSNGWILYLNLISKFFKENIKIYDFRIIEKFFENEIFSKLNENEVEALRIFTLVKKVNKKVFEKYDERTLSILKSLSDRNLFVEDRENFFYIHPIFEEIISKKFGLIKEKNYLKLAKILYKENCFYDSFSIYLKYKDYKSCLKVLEKWSIDLLEKDEIYKIEQLIKLIPEKFFNSNIFLILSEIERNKGNTKIALELIDRVNVEKLSKKFKKIYYLIKGDIKFYNGDYKESLKVLNKIKLKGNFEIRRLHRLGVVYYFLNDEKKCDIFLKKAIKIARDLKEHYREIKILNDYAVALYEPNGKLIEFDITFKKIFNSIQKYHLPYDSIVCGNIAYIKDIFGELDEGERFAKLGLKIAKREDNKLKIIYNLRVLGSIYIKKGEFEKAKEVLEEALALTEESQDPARKIGVLYNLSLLYEKLKDFDKAIFYALEDLNLTKKIGNERYIAQSYLNLGRIYSKFGKYLDSKYYLTKAKEIFEKLKPNLYLFETYIYLILNPIILSSEKKEYKEKIKESIESFGYGFYLKSILDENEIEFLNKELGLDKRKKFIVETFGEFKLIRDGKIVNEIEWKRKSAKDLFKYLLIKGGRALKDEIYEDIFPKLSLKSKELSLRVSISVLRKVLEPNLKRYEKSKLIKVNKDMVYLNLDEFLIDFYKFEELSKKGIKEKNINLINEAIKIYKESFLKEDRYKDFVIYKTNELEEIYKNLLNTLGEILFKENRKKEAIENLKRSLEIDPFQDEILKKFFEYLKSLKENISYNKIFEEYRNRYIKNWNIDITKIVKL